MMYDLYNNQNTTSQQYNSFTTHHEFQQHNRDWEFSSYLRELEEEHNNLINFILSNVPSKELDRVQTEIQSAGGIMKPMTVAMFYIKAMNKPSIEQADDILNKAQSDT